MTLKLGFIGGASDSIVGTSHFCAARLDNRWQIQAACFSRDHARNTSTAKLWSIDPDRCYENEQALLKAEAGKLDAVAILTPSALHAGTAMSAMELGIPVISEKPLFTDSAQTDALIALQKKTDGFLALTYNYSAYAMIKTLREMVESREFGDLWHLHLEMPQAWLSQKQDINANSHLSWRADVDAELPAVLSDLGSHIIHLAGYVTDQWPTEIFSELSSHNPSLPGYVDDARVIMRYKSNMTGSLWLSTTATGNHHGMKLRIHGEKGGASWKQEHPNQLYIKRLDGSQSIIEHGTPDIPSISEKYARMTPGHPPGYIDAFANLYRDMADLIKRYKVGERDPTVTRSAEKNKRLHIALLAIVESAKSGSWIKVE